MRSLQLSQRSRADQPMSPLEETPPKGYRQSRQHRYVVAIIAGIWVISLLCLPVSASAGIDELADAIEQVFEDAMNGLLGTEFQPETIHFAYKPPVGDSVHVDVTLVGYAFCDPPDRWADPNPTPTFPFNAYGCENVATVVATVTPDVTTSDIVIEISDFFMDLQYERDEAAACLECGPPLVPCGTVPGEGFLLTSGTVAATLALEHVGSCFQATIVPGSVAATLVPKDRAFKQGTRPSLTDDTCVEAGWDLFSPLFFDLLNETASAALETVLVEQTTAINQLLCAMTPVEKSTWGRTKNLYR